MFIDTPKPSHDSKGIKQERRKVWTGLVSQGSRDVWKVNDLWVEEADLKVCRETPGAPQRLTGQHHWGATVQFRAVGMKGKGAGGAWWKSPTALLRPRPSSTRSKSREAHPLGKLSQRRSGLK